MDIAGVLFDVARNERCCYLASAKQQTLAAKPTTAIADRKLISQLPLCGTRAAFCDAIIYREPIYQRAEDISISSDSKSPLAPS